MKKKIFYLNTCNTCKIILKSFDFDNFEMREIKSSPISLEELDALYKLTGSFEKLFSKTAMLYRERGLKNEFLKEEEYKRLILEHYTFLKRPVLQIENRVFVGSSKKTVEEIASYFKK